MDRDIASISRLKFSQQLEARFRADRCDNRVRLYRATSLLGVVLYDLFLVTRWAIPRDMFPVVAALRLGVFTPMALAAFWIGSRVRRDSHRDATTAACVAVGVALPAITLIFSETRHALVDQDGSILTGSSCSTTHAATSLATSASAPSALACARAGDGRPVLRTGGEEFLVLLPGERWTPRCVSPTQSASTWRRRAFVIRRWGRMRSGP